MPRAAAPTSGTGSTCGQRPGIGRHFIATAEVTRLGRRVGSTLMRLVHDEGTLIATGAGACMVA